MQRNKRRSVDRLHQDTITYGRLARLVYNSNELDINEKVVLLEVIVERLAECEEQSRVELMERMELTRGLN